MTDNTKPTTDKSIGSEPFEFFHGEPYVNPRKLLMDDDIHDEIEESKPLEESTEKQVKHRIEEVEYESAPETIDIRKQNKMLLTKKTEITKDIIFLDFDGIFRHCNIKVLLHHGFVQNITLGFQISWKNGLKLIIFVLPLSIQMQLEL